VSSVLILMRIIYITIARHMQGIGSFFE